MKVDPERLDPEVGLFPEYIEKASSNSLDLKYRFGKNQSYTATSFGCGIFYLSILAHCPTHVLSRLFKPTLCNSRVALAYVGFNK